MFDILLASRSPAARRTGGTFVSVLVHTVLIAGAAYGTSRPAVRAVRPTVEPITFTHVRPTTPPPRPEPTQPSPVAPDAVIAPPPVEGSQVLVAPVTIANVLPAIDLRAAVTDPADFSGRGRPGGFAEGAAGGVLPTAGDSGTTYLDIQVERQARAVEGSAGPRYPESLRAARIEGKVLAQFVVDLEGRADLATFRVLESAHARFTDAVREAVRRMRFHPAEVGGTPVRQLVRMPFVFALR
jgi:protein TonB